MWLPKGSRSAQSIPAGLLEEDLAVLTVNADREPAHEAEVGVDLELEAQLPDVEVERLVLVVDEYLRESN